MIKSDSEIIIKIIKDASLSYFKEFSKNISFNDFVEKKEDEIIIHFNIKYDRDLEYLISFKKQKTIADNIPNIKGYDKLKLTTNPFKELNFTDENKILANIYDLIKNVPYDEIVCYQKFGIILLNPLNLKGIYNINIKYITD